MNTRVLCQIDLPPAAFFAQFFYALSELDADFTLHSSSIGGIAVLQFAYTRIPAFRYILLGELQMRKVVLLSGLLFGIATSVSAQAWYDYLNGPFHRPTVAFDEVGDNPIPLLMVYADKEVEMSIPDFTSDHGLVERPAAYKTYGTYGFVLYTYFKDSYKTNRSLITGNIRTGEVSYHSMDSMGGIWGPLIKYDRDNRLPPKLDAAVSAYVQLLDSLSNSKEVKEAIQGASPHSAVVSPSELKAEVGANGIYKIGGGVSWPQLINSVEPEFSEEARKAKRGGNVLVNIVVDTNGNPNHIRVIRSVGMGLDEKAMDAVRGYRFKPAMLNGVAVPVELNVEVPFSIF